MFLCLFLMLLIILIIITLNSPFHLVLLEKYLILSFGVYFYVSQFGFFVFVSMYSVDLQRLRYMPLSDAACDPPWATCLGLPETHRLWLPLLGLFVCRKSQAAVLAGVAQWLECRPVNQRVTSLIPSLGHMPGLWARSPVVDM